MASDPGVSDDGASSPRSTSSAEVAESKLFRKGGERGKGTNGLDRILRSQFGDVRWERARRFSLKSHSREEEKKKEAEAEEAQD